MKRHLFTLLFLLVVCIGNHLYAQNGISIGVTPFGKVKIRDSESKMDLLSHQYSFTNPIYQLSYENHLTNIKDLLLEAGYSKVYLIDDMDFLELETDCYSFHGFQGFNLIPRMRVQLPIYIGVGASYFKALKKSGFFVDLAARARLKIYLTNRIALYGGAFYNLGFGGTKIIETRYGSDFGILYSF